MQTALKSKAVVIGLSALALSIVAICAPGAAQAETGACWFYEKTPFEGGCFTTSLEPTPSIEVENGTNTLLIENVNFEVLCGKAKFVEGGHLTINGSITSGRLEFGSCIGLSKTPTLAKLGVCTPRIGLTGSGLIRTEKIVGLIVLHQLVSGVREPVVELKPEKGTTLAKILLGEECAVAEEIIVSGKFILQDTTGKFGMESPALTHTIHEFTPLQLMKVGINKATIDGNALIGLGSHIALPWAGLGA